MASTWSPQKVQRSNPDLLQPGHILHMVPIMLRVFIIEVTGEDPGRTIRSLHPTAIDVLWIAAQVGSNVGGIVFWLVVVFAPVFQFAGCSDDAFFTCHVFADAFCKFGGECGVPIERSKPRGYWVRKRCRFLSLFLRICKKLSSLETFFLRFWFWF